MHAYIRLCTHTHMTTHGHNPCTVTHAFFSKGLGTGIINVFPRALFDDIAKLPNLAQHCSHHGAKSFFGLSRIEG